MFLLDWLSKWKEKRALKRIFAKADNILNNDDYQNSLMNSLMNGMFITRMHKGGAVDVIQNAKGEFGRSITNPIPVNGILGEITYLSRLRTNSDEKVFFHRLGSMETIDVYEMVSVSGNLWDILYLDMYHTRKTRLAPSGYKLQDKTIFICGVNNYAEIFPHSFYDTLQSTISFEKYGILSFLIERDSKLIDSLRRPVQHLGNVKLCLVNIRSKHLSNGTNIIRGMNI